MSAEYLGQVANLVTCEELIELTNFTGGSSNSTGDITWGKILENGSHQELMNIKGKYYNLVKN